MNRLLHNDSVARSGRKGKKPDPRQELVYEPDDMEDAFSDIDVMLEKQARCGTQNIESRRKIEMLREEQRLHRELSDIFDT